MKDDASEPTNDLAKTETAAGLRFGFGRNWQSFVAGVGEAQISSAERSLCGVLGVENLDGKTFLDVGSGSGLFSLAAARLGARRIHSFDFDHDSVSCTLSLKGRFLPDAEHWTVEPGSVLDKKYLAELGSWDIVYAWGVLHHTGAMWTAMQNVQSLVRLGGVLFVSIYNEQGWRSRLWLKVKRLYNHGSITRALVLATGVPAFIGGATIRDILRLRNPIQRYLGRDRGMSVLHDWIDWLGGYPFEVARPEDVIEFYRSRGFAVERMRTVGSRWGCNEFVLRR